MLSAIPQEWFFPFRHGAVAFPRGSLPRKVCIAVLKVVKKGRRVPDLTDEVRPLDAPTLAFASVNSMVVDSIYWYGIQGYEGKLSDVWTALCRTSRNVLEVGGNIGLFTVIGGRTATGRYTVVEPVPANAAILRGNLARNGIDKVELLEAAVIPQAEPRDVCLNIPEEGRDAPVGAHLLEGGEVARRSSQAILTVQGIPFREAAAGRDLIKIDAEGIEADLLLSVADLIAASRPTLVVEVLPEATRLGAVLASFARDFGYHINIVPAYGSDQIVTVSPDAFSAAVPERHKSKDVILSAGPLPGT